MPIVDRDITAELYDGQDRLVANAVSGMRIGGGQRLEYQFGRNKESYIFVCQPGTTLAEGLQIIRREFNSRNDRLPH